jgi:hypothetical protein
LDLRASGSWIGLESLWFQMSWEPLVSDLELRVSGFWFKSETSGSQLQIRDQKLLTPNQNTTIWPQKFCSV